MSDPTGYIQSPSTSSTITKGPARRRDPLSIWFFVCSPCLVYGLVLIPIGIYQFRHPPAVVLPQLHATLWWGIGMTVFGVFYATRFRPRVVSVAPKPRKASARSLFTRFSGWVRRDSP
ncbi:PH domain-containing protein [Tunturibacter empetritectus]|uniref:Uncharacterized protein n=1 Tax=Tunturiibacter lichenicola TaxID=2051959 RepID=A0A7W8J3R4_9BACT|nr:hypothetical protein [Edaphobacter lichenicola]MBB5342053.1 hypothetical protein [Edaphobacter lichenicola]